MDNAEAIAMLENERDILEETLRTAWQQWLPLEMQSMLGPNPTVEAILTRMAEDEVDGDTAAGGNATSDRSATANSLESFLATEASCFASAALAQLMQSAVRLLSTNNISPNY